MRNFNENDLKNSKLIKLVFLIVSFFLLIEKNFRKLNLKANFENSKKSIQQFKKRRRKFEKNKENSKKTQKNEKNRKKIRNMNYD